MLFFDARKLICKSEVAAFETQEAAMRAGFTTIRSTVNRKKRVLERFACCLMSSALPQIEKAQIDLALGAAIRGRRGWKYLVRYQPLP